MELTIDRVTKQYKNKIAVDRLSATLKEGVYGLLGANGAGKTTLMRMICGIADISSGEIRLNGEEIGAMGGRYRELLGYLPQDFGYYPNFTAMEFMLYIASLKGLERRFAKKKSMILLQEVGLGNEMRHKIKTFSGGMRQRLGIAQALLNDPGILVLDEPTSGLDPKERVRFRRMIADLGKDRIVILSTHIVSDVEEIADWIFLMKQGQFIAQGTLKTLKEHYLEVTRTKEAESFNLEKLYLFYFEEGEEEHDAV
ncbi:MAG: ABC transporter ATP-binding protein [Lachnospiraceae bacterium]|nr:ABC transporter ATP-binding protein [Lachnospiraceae bacterium]MDE7447320.1 ABC transporter ATP-binding protein [Lachnospiraceae bacterium]